MHATPWQCHMTRLVFISFVIVQVAQAWKLLLKRDIPPDPRDYFPFYLLVGVEVTRSQ